jgi:insertion element IS1 protein InsB
MQCPDCSSTEISKNGRQRGKQNYICKTCQRQFIEHYDPPAGYIDRVKGTHHTNLIT